MKRLVLVVAVLLIVAVVASPALAQPRPGGGGFTSPAMLLGQKSVQEELKLSDDQLKKVTELGEKSRSAFGQLQGLSREEIQKKFQDMAKESEKAVSEILKPDQAKRLKEISIQVRQRSGLASVLETPEVADALKLDEGQKEKLKALREDSDKFNRELREGGGTREENAKKREEFSKTSNEKVQKVLSDTQKGKLKEMGGAEFKGEIRFGPPRPGGAGGGARPPI